MTCSISRAAMAAGLALGLSFGAPTAKAALILTDDPALGPASLVLDTSTGLEWLAGRFTAGVPSAQIEADLLPGGAFPGFRFGAIREVCTLLADASLPPCNGTGRDIAARERFIRLFGGRRIFSNPLRSDVINEVYDTMILSVLGCSASGGQFVPCFEVDSQLIHGPLDLAGPAFLVRPVAVAEPTSLALISFGLIRGWRVWPRPHVHTEACRSR